MPDCKRAATHESDTYRCHRCFGRGVKTGLAGKPMHRVWWYCARCGGTGVVVLDDGYIVATGAHRAEAPAEGIEVSSC